jgi:tRNA(Glu) U13 pseudouridine synthase TruD
MYKIKEIPEDFKVDEISNVEVEDSGKYLYFLMSKRDYTTLEALQNVAMLMNVPKKFLGFAGTKDRRAITSQMVSCRNCKKDKLSGVKIEDISVEYKGFGSEPISLGDLKGNAFEIVVREVEKKPKHVDKVINYFGEQRFSKNNDDIGKLLVQKKYKEAAQLIAEGEGKHERDVREALNFQENDAIGALRNVPKKILTLYVHAYQSKLWNEMTVLDREEIPIIGFGTEVDADVDAVLKKEGISFRDFIFPAMPEISAEGGIRKKFVDVHDLEIGELEDNDLGEGKKIVVKFWLAKGCYGTEVVKALIENC